MKDVYTLFIKLGVFHQIIKTIGVPYREFELGILFSAFMIHSFTLEFFFVTPTTIIFATTILFHTSIIPFIWRQRHPDSFVFVSQV